MPKSKEPSPTAPDAQDGSARRFTRRSLFGASASAAAAAIVSRPAIAQEGDNLPPSVPEWQLEPGEETLSQPYGRPSKFEANVVRRYRQGLPEPPTRLSSFSLTPLQDLQGIITPNGLHYERHHAGIPTIDPSEHRLMVHGLVERPLIFAMEDITRFPSVSRIHFLECSGNTQNWGAPKPELTAQDTHGLLSCCEWTGVPLATVLAEVGVKPEAKWMLADADAAAITRGIPIEKALDDVLLPTPKMASGSDLSRAIRCVCSCRVTKATPTSNGFGASSLEQSRFKHARKPQNTACSCRTAKMPNRDGFVSAYPTPSASAKP